MPTQFETNIKIPNNGQEIAIRMEKEKDNDEFYQALWWHDIMTLNDKQTLYSFIDKFCPNMESSKKLRIRSGLKTPDDIKYLSTQFKKRTAKEYHEFFGTNM